MQVRTLRKTRGPRVAAGSALMNVALVLYEDSLLVEFVRVGPEVVGDVEWQRIYKSPSVL